MKALIISGNTLQETNWNVEDILTDMPQTTKDVKERMEFQEQYLKREEFYYNHAMALNEK
jgi:dolichyl-phosphate-mannose--protein O-mannosyl transferase